MSFMNLLKNRLVRLVAVVTVCVAMLLSFTLPVAAAGNSPRSKPDEGEAQLDKIYEKSEDALRNPPLSIDKVESESNKGLNEVQGAADAEKMKRPENSQQASSFEEKIEKALEKVSNKS